jgi:N-acetylglutamate synthase-like GNAT family acetyltransferase
MDARGSNIEIRLAESKDAPAIASLLTAAFAEYLALYTPEGYAATAITPEEIVSRIEEGPVWVSIGDGLIVGTVSVVLKSKSLYLRGMAVLPAARGQRIGELLLVYVEKFAGPKEFGVYSSAPPLSWIGQSGSMNVLAFAERVKAHMTCTGRRCLRWKSLFRDRVRTNRYHRLRLSLLCEVSAPSASSAVNHFGDRTHRKDAEGAEDFKLGNLPYSGGTNRCTMSSHD